MKRNVLILTATAMLGIATLSASSAQQATAPLSPASRNGDPVVAAEQAALQRARSQAAEAEKRSEALEKQAGAARTEAEQARRRAAAIAARIQSAEANIAAAEARLAIARRRLGLQQARLAEKQEPVVRLTATLQRLARKPPIAVLAQPGSVSDMVHVRSVLRAILPEVERRTADLRLELDRARALGEEADRALASLQRNRDTLREARSGLTRFEAERRLTSRRLARGAAIEADRAVALGEDARDIGELLGKLEDAADVRAALAGLPGPIARPANPGTAISGRPDPRPAGNRSSRRPAYRLPVMGNIITGLGERTASGLRSRGITIETLAGAQAVAPADGRIAFAGPYRGFGSILIIEHADGWTSLITNLAGLGVAVGDSVRQGDPVGRTGPDSPQVTVELRRSGVPVDILAMTG